MESAIIHLGVGAKVEDRRSSIFVHHPGDLSVRRRPNADPEHVLALPAI